MIVELDTVGVSHELVVGILEAYVRHNALWFRRERERGRLLDDAWLSMMRYEEPAVSGRMRLRDAGRLLATRRGGCGEMTAALAGWYHALGFPGVTFDAMRRSPDTWHAVVVFPGRGTWDPERRLLRAA